MIQTGDAGGAEGEARAREDDVGVIRMTEHAGPDHLKALCDLRGCFLFVINRQFAFDLCFHGLLCLGQHAGDALNAADRKSVV